MVLPPPVAGELFGRAAGDDFVEKGLLVAVFAQQPAQALDVLADAAGAGKDDADAGGGDVQRMRSRLARIVLKGVKARLACPRRHPCVNVAPFPPDGVPPQPEGGRLPLYRLPRSGECASRCLCLPSKERNRKGFRLVDHGDPCIAPDYSPAGREGD